MLPGTIFKNWLLNQHHLERKHFRITSLKTDLIKETRSLLCIMKQVRGILHSQRYDTILLRVLRLPDALAEMPASPHGGGGNRQHPETPCLCCPVEVGVRPQLWCRPLRLTHSNHSSGREEEGNELSLSSARWY